MVEGAKSVLELLDSDFETVMLLGTEKFLQDTTLPEGCNVIAVSGKELEGLGEFRSNNGALAVAKMKKNSSPGVLPSEFVLMLDDISDPGNLGTIIRTADWFGIHKVICSEETADLYNPKVISATMGSFTRVSVFYADLASFLADSKLKVFGAFLEGEDIHRIGGVAGGIILIGSESHGIGSELERFVTTKLTIPRYGKAESLNAAVATAIICDHFRNSR